MEVRTMLDYSEPHAFRKVVALIKGLLEIIIEE